MVNCLGWKCKDARYFPARGPSGRKDPNGNLAAQRKRASHSKPRQNKWYSMMHLWRPLTYVYIYIYYTICMMHINMLFAAQIECVAFYGSWLMRLRLCRESKMEMAKCSSRWTLCHMSSGNVVQNSSQGTSLDSRPILIGSTVPRSGMHCLKFTLKKVANLSTPPKEKERVVANSSWW